MPTTFLAATKDRNALATLKKSLSSLGRIEIASNAETLAIGIAHRSFEFLFVDLDLLQESIAGQETFKQILQRYWQALPGARIVVMVPGDRIRAAVDAVKFGADNYLTYPLDPIEVQYVVESLGSLQRLEQELDYLRDSPGERTDRIFDSHNPGMCQALERMRAAAPTRTTVLLTGETGTGKSLLARFIHDHSTRTGRQFIGVHCGAIPDTLIESELFGHEKGAFTGAVKTKLGKFEIAQGGTLFLDEIGTVTPAAQVKLLQVLQERTFQRVGGETDLTADVRIIAATNSDLASMVDKKEFRTDLFYRLNVFPIEIPPLRERTEDLELLIDSVLGRLNREYAKPVHGVQSSVLKAFRRYPWPGNVRELENLLERAYILETSHLLTPESFPGELFADSAPSATIPLDTTTTLAQARAHAKENAERQYLKRVLAVFKGRINKTAEHAGITPRQLHKLLTRYGIDKNEYK